MEIRRGILRDFDAGTYRASVQIAGSIATWLTGLPVARNIDAAELQTGRSVAVLLFDPSNPNDAVVAAVWA